jgi:hypothetical protein
LKWLVDQDHPGPDTYCVFHDSGWFSGRQEGKELASCFNHLNLEGQRKNFKSTLFLLLPCVSFFRIGSILIVVRSTGTQVLVAEFKCRLNYHDFI